MYGTWTAVSAVAGLLLLPVVSAAVSSSKQRHRAAARSPSAGPAVTPAAPAAPLRPAPVKRKQWSDHEVLKENKVLEKRKSIVIVTK